MKFTIRDVLILTFVVALIAININSQFSLSRAELRLASLREESEQRRNSILSKQDLLASSQAEVDWLTQIGITANNGLAHFADFQAKYSAVTMRDAGTISLRKVPMLADAVTDGGQNRFRVAVPKNTPLFLNFGILLLSPSQSSQDEVAASKILDDSPFVPTGPFQMRLEEGLHELDLLTYIKQEERVFRLTVNNEVAVETVFQGERINGWSSSSVGGIEQYDFAPDRSLPDLWLFRLMWAESVDRQELRYSVRIWLSREEQGFDRFPKQLLPDAKRPVEKTQVAKTPGRGEEGTQ
jgi:hypothetical protein